MKIKKFLYFYLKSLYLENQKAENNSSNVSFDNPKESESSCLRKKPMMQGLRNSSSDSKKIYKSNGNSDSEKKISFNISESESKLKQDNQLSLSSYNKIFTLINNTKGPKNSSKRNTKYDYSTLSIELWASFSLNLKNVRDFDEVSFKSYDSRKITIKEVY